GLPAPSGGVDLPAPMGGIDVVAPKPDQDEIIRFEVPEGVEKLPPASEDLLPEVPDSKPVDIREKRRLPSKIVLIGGGVGLAVLVGGLILILSLIGSSEKSPGQLSIEKGQKLLKLDTYSGYAQAVKAFVTASAALDSKEIPAALQAQAEAIRTIRYNLKKVGTAAQLIKPFAKADKPTQDLLVARALVLFARHDAKTFKALKKCADDRPQDSLASLYLAWFHEKKRHRGAAKVAYKRALAADATLPGALYGLGHLELQTGHSKAARPFFKKALVSSPDHVEALLGTVRLDIIDHKLKAAEKRLNRVGVLSKQHRLSREEKATVYVRRAQLAEAKGDTNKARLFYLDALKLDILSVDALVGAGKIYLASKKYQEANVSFRNAQKIDPMNVEVSLLLATTRLRLGLPAEARDALMPILKREKKNPKIHLVLGTIELAVGAHRAAVKEFKEAITSDPKFFPAYHALAQLYVNRGKSSNAFAVLKKARKALSGEARVLNAIGEIYLAIRQFPAARTRFEEALAKDNNFNLALFNLATTLRQQDKLAAARKAYEKLERRDAHFPGLDAGFGALYTALKEPKEAAASYAKALAADMPSTTLHLEAGQAFINAGLWEKAISEADAALKDPKATSDALALRAEARLVQEDLGDALIEIQRALGREKKSHYFVIYAKILERLHRLADAVKAYKDALKLDPKRIDLRLHRARLQVRGGAVKSAIKELKRIVKAKPKMAEAHFFMGLALADLGKEDKAKRAYEHAISLDPKLAEAHYRLGRLLDDKHKFKAAQKHLEKATALGNKTTPWWTDAYFAVGRIAQTRKQKVKAIAAYQRVLQVARPGDANRQMAIRRLKALGAWKEKED
ncbi:MAG: tetratricopeptide repeat protein, partial [Deltaproteobacteria bacterium]|nr:tetratricopeptide repeat protein [Deltaproteobacteria bacterium]